MGCDIHMYAEIRQNRVKEWASEWNAVGKVFDYPYFEKEETPTIRWYDDSGVSEWNNPKTIHPYQDRNYWLFSILGNVRNYERFQPIAMPRGVPTNASSYYKHEVQEWGEDGHSHSWFTLGELQAFDWSQEFGTKSGKRTYADAAGKFFTETMPHLAAIATAPDVTELRIVFFFDN